MSFKLSLVASVLGAGLAAALPVQASDNPFLPKGGAGLLQLAEGKCGGAAGAAPAEAGQDKCDSDMKCGEGKCGDAMMSDLDDADDKCGGKDAPKADDGAVQEPGQGTGSRCGGAH